MGCISTVPWSDCGAIAHWPTYTFFWQPVLLHFVVVRLHQRKRSVTPLMVCRETNTSLLFCSFALPSGVHFLYFPCLRYRASLFFREWALFMLVVAFLADHHMKQATLSASCHWT